MYYCHRYGGECDFCGDCSLPKRKDDQDYQDEMADRLYDEMENETEEER